MTLLRRRQLLRAATVTALLLCAGARESWTQDAVIRGRVVNDRGEPLPVATVQIQDLNVGVVTNGEGRYVIQIPAARLSGRTVPLRVRTIAHKPSMRQIALVAGEQTQDFTLATDVNLLDAVVVTGVQEATERVKVPFSVTTLDASKLPVVGADPLSQLQGKLAANIVSNSGRPGAQPSVLLRGPTSINAQGRGQDPLYIVDGVIINGVLPDISSQDIESFEVVKGAAGASLYGARAGNGVINITTKSGRRALEGVQFSARSEAGMSDIERDFGLAHFHALLTDETGQRFCQAVPGQPTCAATFDYRQEQARINNFSADSATTPVSLPLDPGANSSGDVLRRRFQNAPWPGTSYNAVKQVVRPQPYIQNSLDMTGRFGGTRFYVSASNLTQRGAIRFLEGFARNSFRANVDQAIGTDWSVALRTSYSRSTQDGLNQEGGGQAFFRLTRVPAIVDVLQRDSLGRLYVRPNLQGGGTQNENPLQSLENVTRFDLGNRFIGGLTLRYVPANWFTLEADVGYDMRESSILQMSDKGYRTTGFDLTTNGGSIFRAMSRSEALNTGVNATFRHDFTPDLRARWSLRYLYEQRDSTIPAAQGNALAVKGVPSLVNTTSGRQLASPETPIRQIGLFAGGGLEYKERYILDALIRRDGSSLFGQDHRWATFGRVSGAWRVAREPWWPLARVSELKLHGSYGTAGGSPNFTAQYETFTITNGMLTLTTLGNRNLMPEVHHEIELGADLELFDRYGLTATYARSTIDNQILLAPVSSSTGYANQWRNAGTLLSITHELSLNVPIVQRPDVSWALSLVYDRNRTWISKLGVPPYFYGAANVQATDQIFQAKAGELYGTFYGRRFLTSCSELPDQFRSDCGGQQSAFQRNDEGWLVWVGHGNNPGMGITDNLWETSVPGCINSAGIAETVCSNSATSTLTAPWGVGLNWGMPIILRGDASGETNAQTVALGNALPKFRFAVTQNFQWKRLSLYALVDAAIGQRVWNQGFHWAHLDFLSKDVDQNGKSVKNAKPIGYYYRAAPPDNSAGLGGLYDILGPNNFSVEDASYAKLRELMVSYRIGAIRGVGDWGVSLVGRNLLTITGYRGFDPEIGLGALAPQTNLLGGGSGGQGSSGAINAVDAFSFPNLRTFTVALTTSF
jgi:TonB-linked SusC/RagA family outer membrane protein